MTILKWIVIGVSNLLLKLNIILEVNNMAIAVIYTTLIIEGDKTYSQVPTRIKPEVKNQLEILGFGELAQ